MSPQLFSLSEQLESRTFLAGDFASLSSHGILSVVGTSKNNAITIDISGSKVRTTRDGVSLSFTKSKVKGIFVDAFKGNDSVRNKTSIPSTLMGSGGNDSITGGTGIDSIDAGTGKDHVNGGGGGSFAGLGNPAPLANKLIISGSDDVIDYSSQPASTFTGTAEANGYVIDYHAAADEVRGSAVFRVLLTPGKDTFFSDAASTPVTVDMGKGNDQFFSRMGIIKRVEGGDGNDTVHLGPENAINEIVLGAGNDKIIDEYGGSATTLIDGGSGTDLYDLQPDAVQVTDPYRRDVPMNVENMNVTTGETGRVVVFGNSASNTINITAQHAEVHGGSGNDNITVHNNAGDSSQIFGDGGDDVLTGGAGNDIIDGGSGHDALFGNAGDDTLLAKDGQTDFLSGGPGSDKAKRDNSASVKDTVVGVETFV